VRATRTYSSKGSRAEIVPTWALTAKFVEKPGERVEAGDGHEVPGRQPSQTVHISGGLRRGTYSLLPLVDSSSDGSRLVFLLLALQRFGVFGSSKDTEQM